MKQYVRYLWPKVRHPIRAEDYGCRPGVITWEYLNAIWSRRFDKNWTPKS